MTACCQAEGGEEAGVDKAREKRVAARRELRASVPDENTTPVPPATRCQWIATVPNEPACARILALKLSPLLSAG